jgi:hypothetical protein
MLAPALIAASSCGNGVQAVTMVWTRPRFDAEADVAAALTQDAEDGSVELIITCKRTRYLHEVYPARRQAAGWDEMLQVREEFYFTKGRIIARGRLVARGKAKKADFVIYYNPNILIALIEAKWLELQS